MKSSRFNKGSFFFEVQTYHKGHNHYTMSCLFMMQSPLLFLVMYDWIYLYDTMLLLCMHWFCFMMQRGCYVNLVHYLCNMIVGYDANMPSAS
jgi:hypothetical protein